VQASDSKQFVAIVTGFAELKGKQLSHAALDLYWNAMQDWTIDEFRQAANHLIKTCEFMPTPKDFEDLRRASKPAAAEVWALARKSIQYTPHGYVEKAGIDPLISQALRVIGGPDALAMCPADKLTFLEKRFSEAYAGLDAATVTRTALPSVAKPQISQEQAQQNRQRLIAALQP
jgi:hypothetical protein